LLLPLLLCRRHPWLLPLLLRRLLLRTLQLRRLPFLRLRPGKLL
jgi:hypothetical protein